MCIFNTIPPTRFIPFRRSCCTCILESICVRLKAIVCLHVCVCQRVCGYATLWYWASSACSWVFTWWLAVGLWLLMDAGIICKLDGESPPHTMASLEDHPRYVLIFQFNIDIISVVIWVADLLHSDCSIECKRAFTRIFI